MAANRLEHGLVGNTLLFQTELNFSSSPVLLFCSPLAHPIRFVSLLLSSLYPQKTLKKLFLLDYFVFFKVLLTVSLLESQAPPSDLKKRRQRRLLRDRQGMWLA